MTTGRPGAAHIGLPFDVQRDPVDEAAVHADPTLGRYPARRAAPEPAAIEAAAQAILSAARPLLICGGGPVIAGAQAELGALAELLGAPVATTISGQGSIAEDHPLALGVVGSNGGTPETRAVIDQADLIVFVGCRAGSVTTERWRHPAPGQVRVVHIDVDPTVIGVNYPTEVAVVGDARLALAALRDEVAHTHASPDRPTGRARVARAKAEKFASIPGTGRAPMRRRSDRSASSPPCRSCCRRMRSSWPTPAPHARISRPTTSSATPAGTSSPTGRTARSATRCRPPSARRSAGRRRNVSRSWATAASASPRASWRPSPGSVCRSLFWWSRMPPSAGSRRARRPALRGRYFAVDFTPGQHARIAQAYGIKAWRVEDPADLRPALAKALAAGAPTLVDIVTQPLHEARAPVSEWVA